MAYVLWPHQSIAPQFCASHGNLAHPLRLPLPMAKLTDIAALDPPALPSTGRGAPPQTTGIRPCPGCTTRAVAPVWGHDARAGLKVAVATFVPRIAPQGWGPASSAAGTAGPRGSGAVLGQGRGPRDGDCDPRGSGTVVSVREGPWSPRAEGHSPWVRDYGPCG